MSRQFHRPARLEPETAESLLVTEDTAVASQLAHHTAQLLLGVPDDGDRLTRDGVLAAVARHGVDDVAEMWASSPATTLPGVLWRLFLVREWIRRDPALIERRYATTVDLTAGGTRQPDAAATARLEAALAQGRAVPDPEQVRAQIDTLLQGRLTYIPDGVAHLPAGATAATDEPEPADTPAAAPADVPAAAAGNDPAATVAVDPAASAQEGASGTALARLLAEVAWFLRALAAGSSPVWIEEDTDALASPVTRRDSALVETARELEEAARRAAAGRLD